LLRITITISGTTLYFDICRLVLVPDPHLQAVPVHCFRQHPSQEIGIYRPHTGRKSLRPKKILAVPRKDPPAFSNIQFHGVEACGYRFTIWPGSRFSKALKRSTTNSLCAFVLAGT